MLSFPDFIPVIEQLVSEGLQTRPELPRGAVVPRRHRGAVAAEPETHLELETRKGSRRLISGTIFPFPLSLFFSSRTQARIWRQAEKRLLQPRIRAKHSTCKDRGPKVKPTRFVLIHCTWRESLLKHKIILPRGLQRLRFHEPPMPIDLAELLTEQYPCIRHWELLLAVGATAEI